jgi:hypothetical protein
MARPGGITSPGCVSGGADGADQRHARTGKEYGRTAPQVFQPELPTKSRGGSSRLPVQIREALLPLVRMAAPKGTQPLLGIPANVTIGRLFTFLPTPQMQTNFCFRHVSIRRKSGNQRQSL